MSGRVTHLGGCRLFLYAVGYVALFALLTYVASLIWPRFVDTSFQQLLAANLLGVLVGAFAALWANRRLGEEREARRKQKEETQRLSAAMDALQALRRAVQHNEHLVRQAASTFSSEPQLLTTVVYFKTDPEMLDDLLPNVLKSTGDVGLVRQAGDFRYQLRHLGRKLDVQAELFNRPEYRSARPGGPSTVQAARDQREEIVRSIVEHSRAILEDAVDLKSAIDNRIEDLEARVRQAE